jgi:peptidyl-prolyl cis-trans isomerase D
VILPTPTLSLTQLALLPPTPTPGPTETPEFEPELEATETQIVEEEEQAETQATETPVVEEQPTITSAEPTATLAPSPTPTTYTLDLFQQNYQESLTYLSENLGMSEAEFRYMIENQILRTRVLEAITADISTEQEQVWARHILVADAETAQEVLDRLEAGDDFAALAAEYSMDGSGTSGGDLGWFTRDMMVAEFSEAAFNLEIGEISPAVESQFGFHIIQVLGKDVFPLTGTQLDQARETRFQEWLADQREASQVEIFDRWVEVTPSSLPFRLNWRRKYDNSCKALLRRSLLWILSWKKTKQRLRLKSNRKTEGSVNIKNERNHFFVWFRSILLDLHSYLDCFHLLSQSRRILSGVSLTYPQLTRFQLQPRYSIHP